MIMNVQNIHFGIWIKKKLDYSYVYFILKFCVSFILIWIKFADTVEFSVLYNEIAALQSSKCYRCNGGKSHDPFPDSLCLCCIIGEVSKFKTGITNSVSLGTSSLGTRTKNLLSESWIDSNFGNYFGWLYQYTASFIMSWNLWMNFI
jgi:hypothetical protein